MAISNHERVGKALDLLKAGLRPYFEREMRAAFGDKWLDTAFQLVSRGAVAARRQWGGQLGFSSAAGRDGGAVEICVSKKLDKAERNLVEELRNTRNDWAHQKTFSADDT